MGISQARNIFPGAYHDRGRLALAEISPNSVQPNGLRSEPQVDGHV
jgi:hypothetical protein